MADPMEEDNDWWEMSWIWVAGYTSLSTLVLVFNLVIIYSVLSNKYLRYSFHYVMIVLSLRSSNLSLQ